MNKEIIQQINSALNLAMAICDAVPTRAHDLAEDESLRHIGSLVNSDNEECRKGYTVIRDAQAALAALECQMSCEHSGGPQVSEPGSMVFGESNSIEKTPLNGLLADRIYKAITNIILEDREVHHDDIAVNHFADAMRAKMAASRAKGRGGWGDTGQCPTERLQAMLFDHLAKGDPIDVANFCMMLWARNEPVAAPLVGAAGWLPTVEAVNALPQGIRQYVQQLEAEVNGRAIRVATEQRCTNVWNDALEDAAIICDNFAAREMHPAECAGAIRKMKGSIK